MKDLYDLETKLKRSKDSKDFINQLIDKYKESNSDMRNNNLLYTLGAISALYYAGLITQEEFTNYYKYFGL
jgi:uncharacterized protein YbaP (TraB family)